MGDVDSDPGADDDDDVDEEVGEEEHEPQDGFAPRADSTSLSKVEAKEEGELIDRNAEYQIRPSLVDKFKPHLVKEVIHAVLHDELGGKEYSVESSEEWTKNIVSNVKEGVKELGFKRYKIISQVILGQNKGSGVKIGARCLWDADTDNYASEYFLNDTIFCCAIVFGIYCY